MWSDKRILSTTESRAIVDRSGLWSEPRSGSTTNSRGRETPGAVWRQMTSQDLKKVHCISLCQWGTDYYECIEVFQDKLDFYPEGCFVYEDENQIKGYLISHPWESTNIPLLNQINVIGTGPHPVNISIIPTSKSDCQKLNEHGEIVLPRF